MKKILLLVLCLSFVIGAVYAKAMQPTAIPKPIALETNGRHVTPHRDTPAYTFTKTPTSLMVNYYDYMIGSYNGLPIRVIPQGEYGGGYFMTYHGKRTPTGTRRAFYAHIAADGSVVNNNEISPVTNHEGYATLAVDPVSGKPLYAWHANGDDDPEMEVEFSSDAYLTGISGLFNEIQIIADNPQIVTPGVGTATSDNEFLWPTAQIGPSPVANMRRVYVAMRNFVSHTFGPSENIQIAYADFNGDMLEGGIPLQWSHTSIPEMNQWNHDTTWRRPFHAITSDNFGNLYYAGYHFATEADGSTDIPEADFDIFMCDNYGQGTWRRVSDYSHVASWNPAGTPGGTGYFVGDGNVPYPDNELVWALANSSHLNSVTDNRGRIIVPGVWAHSTTAGGYWPEYQTVKSMIFNPMTSSFKVSEIYPQKHPEDTNNAAWTPWDLEAPWGEPEYFPGSDGGMYLSPELIYPFPHWDDTLHTDAMMFHYNNIKVSEVNEHGMLVAVWQDSRRARSANKDSDPDYVAFSQVPEIYISVSANQGDDWSEPIILNSVETQEFAGIKPMWVYPADKVLYVDTVNEHKIGKIGFMLYNDYTWGSNANTPPAHPNNDGGEVMFMEMQITFPPHIANEEGTAPAIARMLNANFPNPFNPETTISFDMPKTGNARLDIYNVKGQIVKTLFNGTAPYGKTSLVWNGTDNNAQNVTSGIYFYRLSTDQNSETRKMMLMK